MEHALGASLHNTLLLLIALLLVVCLLVMLGQRLRISYPIFLVVSGVAISYVPGVPPIRIEPELIFLIFLPPLLYEAAWFTSWKDFWKWKRVILSFAFPVVIVTATLVAFVAAWVIPGFTLALGFLLGGIVSPPDALAATSVLKGSNIPRRLIMVIEGESLVNDASSLIVFRFAMAAVISGTFIWSHALVDFGLVTVGGVVVGVLVGLVFYPIHRWLPTTPSITTLLTLITPYAMYLLAETIHVSGVMAVVSGGLFMAYRSPVLFDPEERMQSLSTWATVGFVLNAIVFLLIGLQMPIILQHMDGYSLPEAILYGIIITSVLVVSRIGFSLFASYWTVFISRWIKVQDSSPGWRGPLVLGWAGMRGVVSLAAALSIPILGAHEQAFPQRSLILFITFTVIVLTLVVQGLTLPWVVRKVKVDWKEDRAPDEEQEVMLQLKLAKYALERFKELYPNGTEGKELLTQLRHRLDNEVRLSRQWLEAEECQEHEHEELAEYHRVFSEMVHIKRQTLLKLRDRDEFDDEVIRKQEEELDLEERRVHLTGGLARVKG